MIVVTVLAILVLTLTDAHWVPWVSAIVVASLGFAAVSFIVNLRYPDASEAAWDEMNQRALRASLAFGYWAALTYFMIALAAVLLDRLDAAMAFFWLGPILGIAPALHFLTSVARGHAE